MFVPNNLFGLYGTQECFNVHYRTVRTGVDVLLQCHFFYDVLHVNRHIRIISFVEVSSCVVLQLRHPICQ